MIRFILDKWKTKKLEAKKRAYLRLYSENDFFKIRAIRRDLGKVRFPQISSENDLDLELITRQYFLNLFGTGRLENQILLSLGTNKTIRFYPLHYSYGRVLKSHDIKISIFFTHIFFLHIIFGLWLRGVLRLFIQIFNTKGVRQEDTKGKPYVYFDKLTVKNLPDYYPDGSSYDLINWYIDRIKPNQKHIYHNVENASPERIKDYDVIGINGPLPVPKSFNRYFFNSFKLIFQTLFSFLIKGEWWRAMLLNEFIDAKRFDYVERGQIANRYLFYNSITFYRPVWTYIAEKKGAKIISYFYSTSESIMLPEGPEEDSHYIELMNWPEIWVWDEYQKRQLQEIINKDINFKIVGAINFTSKAVQIEKSKKFKIAIFDSAPFKVGAHFGFSTSNGLGLNEADIHINFIKDIVSAFHPYKVEYYFKPKRNRNKDLEVEKYISTIKTLQEKDNFHILDGDMSAHYLIENTDLAISFPFTSTGVIAQLNNKLSVYYDPSKKVSKKDKAAHGLPLLSSKEELMAWVKQVNLQLL